MGKALENAANHAEQLEKEKEDSEKELMIKAYEAETKRIQAVGAGMSPEQVQALVMQTVQQALATPPPAQEIYEDLQESEQQEGPHNEGFFNSEEPSWQHQQPTY
jgi:uncharacterized protein YdeI (YjbR/CyaY-like superfamily)